MDINFEDSIYIHNLNSSQQSDESESFEEKSEGIECDDDINFSLS